MEGVGRSELVPPTTGDKFENCLFGQILAEHKIRK